MNDERIEEDKILQLLEITESWDKCTYEKFYSLVNCAISRDVEQIIVLAEELDALKFAPGIKDVESYARINLEIFLGKRYIEFIDLKKYGNAFFEGKYIYFRPKGMIVYEGDEKKIMDMFEEETLTEDITNEMEMH